MAKKKMKLFDDEIRSLLRSSGIQEDLRDVAEELIQGDSRYSIERQFGNNRATLNILDSNDDAVAHEAKTGELSKKAKRKI